MHLFTRYSLRELLLVVFVAGLGFASLRLGGIVAQCFFLTAILVSMTASIAACVCLHADRTRWRGFIVPVAVYFALLWSLGRPEFSASPSVAKLPTSQLVRTLYGAFKADKVGQQTGYGGMGAGYVGGYGGYGGGYGGSGYAGGGYGGAGSYGGGDYGMGMGMSAGAGAAGTAVRRLPDPATFFSVGHVLWGLLFGYVGSKLACFLAQNSVPKPPNVPPSN